MSGWAALAGAATGAAGGLLTNYLNSREMKKQREWLEKMSNTAHQREVTDLREAGLNPILSATGGNGASTPSASIVPMEDPIEKGINSALAIRNQQSQINLQESQAAQAQTQAGLNSANAKQAEENVNLMRSQQAQIAENIKKIGAEIQNLRAGTNKTNIDAKFGSGEVGTVAKLGNTLLDSIPEASTFIKKQFDTMYSSAEKTASKLGTDVKNLFNPVVQGVRNTVNSAFSGMASGEKKGTD